VNAKQFAYKEIPLAAPQPPGTGRILFKNGREMVGTWHWNINLLLGVLTDTAGIQWIIDVNEVAAFSPITETPG
jgi:hypothetical protein